MDDQNNTNQPLDQGTSPGTLPVEDITPAADTSITPAPAPEPEVVPPAPTTTFTTTVTTPAPEASPVPTPTPAPVETAMPEPKRKGKAGPVVGALVALLLVVGVAGAAYYVSNQLSTRQAVAPNAPTSKPAASELIDPNAPKSPKCPNSECTVEGATSCWTTTNTIWVCHLWGGSCPGGYYANSGTACGGGGGGSVSVSGTTCVKGGSPACGIASTNGEPNNCPTSNFQYQCGMECCNQSASAVCCCTGCFPAGTDCSLHQCAAAATCDAAKRDTPASKSITFAKAGNVTLFTRNAAGTVTLTGPKTVTIPMTTGDAVEQTTKFQVAAGETYTIDVKLSDPTEQGKSAYGWIPNKSANVCGPVKTPGMAIDANNKPTGLCGDEVNISAVESLATKADLTGITAGGANANTQCWGDAELGDATQDFDYNDFTLVFGYEKSAACVPDGTVSCTPDCPTACGTAASTISTCTDSCGGATTKACAATADCGVGACVLMNIYKKVDGVIGSNKLTDAQLQSLKVGDVLVFTLASSMDNLDGRFRVTVNGVAGEWLPGTIYADNKKAVKSAEYTVATAGTYKFEAQVSIAPSI